ncbi:unnamed protein product [Lathyrus sativus]|nr:unnamed protein product [Lathyrus sativus]
MEFNTDSFGVTRPPSESLPERGKLLKLESELQPNLEPESDLQPNLEPESELQPNLGSKPQPELELQPNLEPESDLQCKPKLEYLLSSKSMKKLKMSDLSIMYDDDPKPFQFMCPRFVYKNKARIKLDEEIKVAMDDYRERSRNLSPFDAICRPKVLMLENCGGGPRPIPITESKRLELTPLCKLALDKYNADKDTHFVFADIVKTTWRPGAMYYITFLAQDSSNNNNNTSLTTFQAQVSNMRPAPEIYSCAIKT